MAEKNEIYRVGQQQPQNLYRGEQYIGVMFSPEDAALVVAALNQVPGEPPYLLDSRKHRWKLTSPGIYHLTPLGRIDWTRAEIDREYGPVTEVWE